MEPEPETLAGALVGLLEAEALRERLRSAGLERAAGFSWARSAQLVDDLVGREPANGERQRAP